jgi:hypothetical protein
LLDAEEHAVGIDVRDFEGDGFGDTETGAVTGHEDGAVLDAGDVIEEVDDLFVGEDNGKAVMAADAWEVLFAPGHLEGVEVKELDSGDERVDALGREFLFVEQVEFILANGFEVEKFGTGLEKLGEIGYIMDIVPLSGGREAAQLHVLEEAFAKRFHGVSHEIGSEVT